MKNSVVPIILFVIALGFIFLFPSDFFISSYYHQKVTKEFSEIPVRSEDGRCLRDAYSKEGYFIFGPPIEMEPYNPPIQTCWFVSTESSNKALNFYKNYLTAKGWEYQPAESHTYNEEANGGLNCAFDVYWKNDNESRLSLGINNCPYAYSDSPQESEWQSAGGDPKKNRMEFSLGLKPSDQYRKELRTIPVVALLLKAIAVLLMIGYLIRKKLTS